MAGSNYAGITPETIAAISGARSAQSQLNGLANNPATIQALRQANTPYTTVSGQGSSATAPGALEAVGNIMLRNKGSQGIREMQAQSDALRGQVRQGAEAEMQMGLQQDAQKAVDEKARADADRQAKLDIAGLKTNAQMNSGLGRSRFQYSPGEDEFGNKIFTKFDKYDGGAAPTTVFADGSEYSLDAARVKSGRNTGKAGDVAQAKEQGKTNVTRAAELRAASDANANTLNNIDQAINALKAGAGSGPIESRLPSFRAPSISLDNAKDKLGLTEIGKYTFGSLSEAEGQWLRESGIPNLDEDELIPYMEHRREATLRAMEASQYEKEALEAGETVDPEIINAILTDGGFKMSLPEKWK